MKNPDEYQEREQRRLRLKEARERAGFSGQTEVAKELNISVNTYKAHEQGRNDFGTSAARAYARLFNVSLQWLYLGAGRPEDGVLPGNAKRLQDIFERLCEAPEDIQAKVISYAEFELERLPKSREMATNPAS